MRQNLKKTILVLSFMMLALSTCPEDCWQCDPSGFVCFACKDDLEASVFGKCHQNTIEKCVIYGPNDQCFNCQPTFQLSEGKCMKDYTGCVLANSHDGSCFECGFSTQLMGSTCSGVINCEEYSQTCSKCVQGYTLSNNVCMDTSDGCKKVRGNDGLCEECKEGYVYVGFQCISKKVVVPRCYIYSADGKCKLCKNGFNLFENMCLLAEEIQKFMLAKVMGTDGTFGFTLEGFVEGGKSLQSVVSIQHNITHLAQQTHIQQQSSKQSNSFGGKENDMMSQQPSHCQVEDKQNPGSCLICKYGYFPENSKCRLVSKWCEGHNVQTGECFACKYGLYLEDGNCIDLNCLTSDGDDCRQCKSDHKKDENGVCVYNDPNCLESFNDRCDVCREGYFVHASGKCQVLPPNCQFANFQTSRCLECKSGYTLQFDSGECTQEAKLQNCEVPDLSDPSKCLICVYGWYPSGSQCLKVSPLCKDHNVQTGQCLSCAHPKMQLVGGRCKDGNCQTFDGDQCIACKRSYKYNEVEGMCQFSDPFCQRTAPNGCLVCLPGYYVNLDYMCSQLPPHCSTARADGVCSQCMGGYEVSNGICGKAASIPNCLKVDHANNKCFICDDRYYVHGNGCARVADGCGDYHPTNGQCFTCATGYTLSDSTCIMKHVTAERNVTEVVMDKTENKQKIEVIRDTNCLQSQGGVCILCSKRYYANPVGKCVPVNPLCRDHNMHGECTECYQGYSVQAGKCTISLMKDTNCKTVEGNLCVQCYHGYYYHMHQQLCKRINPLCKTSNKDNGDCTSCYPGYTLNGGNCAVFLRDPNCKNFNPNKQCTLCASRYWLHKSGKCSPVSPMCNDYDAATGGCTSCYPGYVVSGDKCVQGSSKDPNCKVFGGRGCSECFSGYLVIGGQCKQTNPLCRTFSMQTGKCTSCYAGYTLMDGNCDVGSPKDPNCKQFSYSDSSKCEQCYGGYLAIGGRCVVQNPLCKDTNKENGGCSSCWPGYVLKDWDCLVEVEVSVKVTAVNDVYCVKINGDICEQCSSGYYYDKQQYKCKQVDPLCRDHNKNNGWCTDCYQGFTLHDGKCTVARVVQVANCLNTSPSGVCMQCLDKFYLSGGECKLVSILCDGYDRSNGLCTSCISGHFLQEGKCIFPAHYDARCVWYDNAFCSRCQDGYFVNHYVCEPVDRNCMDFSQDRGECMKCANGLLPKGVNCF